MLFANSTNSTAIEGLLALLDETAYPSLTPDIREKPFSFSLTQCSQFTYLKWTLLD